MKRLDKTKWSETRDETPRRFGLRPRRDPRRTGLRPRRDRDVGHFGRDETEMRRWYVIQECHCRVFGPKCWSSSFWFWTNWNHFVCLLTVINTNIMTTMEEFVVKMRQLIDTERQAEIDETKCVMHNTVRILFIRSLLASYCCIL